MSSQSHVSHCRVLPLGEFTVMIPEPHGSMLHCRVQSPGEINVMIVPDSSVSIRHIENRFSPYFIYFKNEVWALTSGGFRIVSDTLV